MSVTNYTEHFGLPLPISTDGLQYQDFINTPNEKIDSELWQLSQEQVTMNQQIGQNTAGLSAADTKISGIQSDLSEWNVPEIKMQTSENQQDIAELKTSVGSITKPVPVTMLQTNGNVSVVAYISGGIFYSNAFVLDTNAVKRNITSTLNAYGDFTENFPLTAADGLDAATISGNILNLPSNNTLYNLGRIGIVTITQSGITGVRTVNGYAIYNSISTTIGITSPPFENGTRIEARFIIPLL